jgi:hypothetical protein
MTIGLLSQPRAMTKTYATFLQWRYNSLIRLSMCYDVCMYTINAIYTYVIPSAFTNPDSSRAALDDLFLTIDRAGNELNRDEDFHSPIANYDDELDVPVLEAGREPIAFPDELHGMSNCAGSEQLIRIFAGLSSTIVLNLPLFNGTLMRREGNDLIHLLTQHIHPALTATETRIVQPIEISRDDFRLVMTILLLGALPFSVATFGLSFALLLRLETAHGVVVADPDLLAYVLGTEHRTTEMSTVQAIVHGSSDGIALASVPRNG